MQRAYLISINPPYTDMIFQKEKRYEFRNVIIKTMSPGDILYIYETKNGGGIGMVVGYAIIEKIVCQTGKTTQGYLPHSNQDAVNEVLEDVKSDLFSIVSNEERSLLLKDDDEYRKRFWKLATKVGARPYDTWNYAIRLGEVTRFKNPKKYDEFEGKNGKVKWPPQNMMEVNITGGTT